MEKERKSKKERERKRERAIARDRDIRISRSRYTKQHNIYRSIKQGNVPSFNNHTYTVTTSLPIYSTVLYNKGCLLSYSYLSQL